jgi:hypothetical protein
MPNPVRARGIKTINQVCSPAKRADTEASTQVFAEGRQIGAHPVCRLKAAGSKPGGLHLVEDNQRAAPLSFLGDAIEKLRIGRQAATAAQHGLYDDGRNIAAVPAHGRLDRFKVVESR